MAWLVPLNSEVPKTRVLPWLILRLAAGLERHTEDTIKSWECLAEYLPRSGGDANMS